MEIHAALLNQRAPAAGRGFHSYKWGSALEKPVPHRLYAAKRPAFRVEDDHPECCPRAGNSEKMDHAAEDRLHRLLKLYGLEQFEHSRPSELSGGMRQRAALIRTLALEPELLLLDEPFSALDYQTRLTVCDDISTIIRESRKTAILITHDLSEAVSAADRILVLTKRPGTICRILPVTFPLSANRPLERRNDPAFSLYFNELWKTLQGKGEGKKYEM